MYIFPPLGNSVARFYVIGCTKIPSLATTLDTLMFDVAFYGGFKGGTRPTPPRFILTLQLYMRII